MYTGSKKIELAEMFFRRTILPKWKMEKVIYQDLAVSKLKISENLPHQWEKCVEVCDSLHFLHHIQTSHGCICPAGSLINGWPHLFWLLWYDDRNILRFHNKVGTQNYIKAKLPWIDWTIQKKVNKY